MDCPLASLADVSTGITLRGADAAKPRPDGNFCLLRIGDLREDGRIQLDTHPLIKIEPDAAERYRLKPGDVIVAAKGSRATAAVFESPIPTVAGGQFFVVRPNTELVLPGFLRWYLNLPETQAALMDSARGSYVQAIPIAAVKELRIPLPPLDTQRRIATILDLHAEERRLMQAIAFKRSQLVHAQINALAGGRNRHSH